MCLSVTDTVENRKCGKSGKNREIFFVPVESHVAILRTVLIRHSAKNVLSQDVIRTKNTNEMKFDRNVRKFGSCKHTNI